MRDVFPNDKIRLIPGGQLSKYLGEQSPWHDGQLTWPGVNGVPVIDFTRQNDGILNIAIVNYFHAKLFDLSQPEDLEHYLWCQDRIYNGWFLVNRTEYKWTDTGMKVYMEWVQRYVKQVPTSGYDLEQFIPAPKGNGKIAETIMKMTR